MLDTHRLRAWPLTPIHIGDGQEITPESFTLERDRLIRFSPFAALARAGDPQREQYRQLLKRGDFVGAQRHLAKLAADGSTGDPGVRVAPACQSDLKAVLEGRSIGKGRVQPFVRCGEAAIIPGSTLKGALRTAWISREAAHRDPRGIGPVDIRWTGQAAAELSRRVLDIEGSALEQDPFRDLYPRDAAIPAGRTRFDRAVLAKLARDRPGLAFDQTDRIQMHVERLDCLADGALIAPFDVQIDISGAAYIDLRAKMAAGPKRKAPKTPLNADDLWQAANVFHADLWLYERARFHGGEEPSGRLLDRLLAAFGLTAGADLADQLTRRGLVLLRLGRYAQFESKAIKVDGKRHGIRAGTKVKPAELMDGGVTRTVVRVAGDIPVPFGWLVMARVGHGPAGAVRAELAELARAATPPPRAARAPVDAPVTGGQALAGKTLFKKGDRVRHPDYGDGAVAKDVGLNDKTMEVDFDGEVEPVKVEGWTRR
jgi:CRISPR-associated protein Csm5